MAHIFSHPLEAILDPAMAQKENLVSPGTEDWIYDTEFHVRRFLFRVSFWKITNTYIEHD